MRLIYCITRVLRQGDIAGFGVIVEQGGAHMAYSNAGVARYTVAE